MKKHKSFMGIFLFRLKVINNLISSVLSQKTVKFNPIEVQNAKHT